MSLRAESLFSKVVHRISHGRNKTKSRIRLASIDSVRRIEFGFGIDGGSGRLTLRLTGGTATSLS